MKGQEAIAEVRAKVQKDIEAVASAARNAVANSLIQTAQLYEQKAILESLLQPTHGLIDLLDTQNNLKETVTPSLVAKLLERFIIYCNQRYPDAIVNAWFDPDKQEFVLNPFLPSLIKLSELLKLAAYAFRNCVAQEEREKQ